MITALATPLSAPLSVILTESGDEHAGGIPLTAWRDEENRPFVDGNNNYILS